jgi:serine/threonine protein kinase
MVGIVVVLIVFLSMIRKNRAASGEPEHLRRVRDLVNQGNYKQAAELQLARGHKEEAYNLLERGKLYDEAARLAEELGKYDRAARHAESAGMYERAADLYARVENFGMAARLYHRMGLFAKAAAAMERDASVEPQHLVNMWEQALMAILMASNNQALTSEQLKEIQDIANKAALIHERLGNLQRAIQLYEISQNRERAKLLEQRLQHNPLAQLTTGSTQTTKASMGGQYANLPTAFPSAGMFPTADGGLSSPLTPYPMDSGLLGASPETLRQLSQLVDSAVHRAIQQNPVKVQVVSLTNASELSSDDNVVQILDLETNTSTMVQRDSERYLLKEEIGKGGMAVVYKAFDRVLEREVALKFLPTGVTQSAKLLGLFEREAKAAAALNHPNIITIYDYGVMSQRPFICMELLKGMSLDKLLTQTEGKGLPLLSIFEISEGLLAALDFAHSKGFVHRDIKPANIMCTNQQLIKLMDFGIAKHGDSSQTTIIAGTPSYMSPEQMVGKNIDHRTDLFAVGATLYELLTGVLPFEGLMRHKLPPAPSHLRLLPKALDKVILNCMAFESQQRPQSAYNLRRILRDVRKEIERDPIYASQLETSSQLDSFFTTNPDMAPFLQSAHLPDATHNLSPEATLAASDPGQTHTSLLTDIIDDYEPPPKDAEIKTNSIDDLLATYLEDESK